MAYEIKVTQADHGMSFAGQAMATMVKGTLVRIDPASIAGKPGVFDAGAQLILASGIRGAGLLERDVIAGTVIPLSQIVYGDQILSPKLVGDFVAARQVREYECEGTGLILTTGPKALANDTPLDSELSNLGGLLCLRGDLSNKEITGNTVANPTVVTTATPHGLITGQTVTIADSDSTPTLNGARVVTVLSPTTFSVPVNASVVGTVGSVSVPKPELFGWLRGHLAPYNDGNFRLLVEVAQ